MALDVDMVDIVFSDFLLRVRVFVYGYGGWGRTYRNVECGIENVEWWKYSNFCILVLL